MKTKQTSPPTTIDEQESIPNHGRKFYKISNLVFILY
jgi:hypothetical protein